MIKDNKLLIITSIILFVAILNVGYSVNLAHKNKELTIQLDKKTEEIEGLEDIRYQLVNDVYLFQMENKEIWDLYYSIVSTYDGEYVVYE